MQAALQKPALATEYLFRSAPSWIASVGTALEGRPVALRVGAASSVGALAYGTCAAIALFLQLPCTVAQRYVAKPQASAAAAPAAAPAAAAAPVAPADESDESDESDQDD